MMPGIVDNPDAASVQHRLLDHIAVSRRFTVSPAAIDDLPVLMEMTSRHIPRLLGAYVDAHRVHAFSSSILAIRDRRGLAGSFAFLFLNQRGFDALLAGTFPIESPDTDLLARANEKAAALYAWAMCLPGPLVAAMGNVMEFVRRPLYAEADMYARPGTLKGGRFMIKTGFHPLGDAEMPSTLWVYRRPTPLQQAAE
jgi:hypothetical protein